jgi:hypothetical protein
MVRHAKFETQIFLGTFAKLRKAIVSFHRVRPHGTTRLPLVVADILGHSVFPIFNGRAFPLDQWHVISRQGAFLLTGASSNNAHTTDSLLQLSSTDTFFFVSTLPNQRKRAKQLIDLLREKVSCLCTSYLCIYFLTTLSDALVRWDLVVEWSLNNEQERVLKETVVANLKQYSGICLRGLRKTAIWQVEQLRKWQGFVVGSSWMLVRIAVDYGTVLVLLKFM